MKPEPGSIPRILFLGSVEDYRAAADLVVGSVDKNRRSRELMARSHENRELLVYTPMNQSDRRKYSQTRLS
jgi:hypothetical protein